MKLIKITDEHYVIVDDLQIEEGDWYIDDTLQILQALPSKKDWINSGKSAYIICKKITHSTVPKGFMLLEGVNRLSLQEVKELIGEADVEKKAREEHEQALKRGGSEYAGGYYEGLLDGYNQALEDNKEKKYTEEDILMFLHRTAYKYFKEGKECKGNMAIAGDPLHGVRSELKEMLQSLQPKTEWEVEIVDGKIKLK